MCVLKLTGGRLLVASNTFEEADYLGSEFGVRIDCPCIIFSLIERHVASLEKNVSHLSSSFAFIHTRAQGRLAQWEGPGTNWTIIDE